MNNLVIGSEGFVGRPFCAFLRARGETVRPFDRVRSAAEDARTAALPLSDIQRVYFLAWDVGGAKYLYRGDSQLEQMHWNLALMQNVFRQLAGAGIPFLFVSSQLADTVETVYGVTKRLGEVWTRLLPAGVCVRLWNVYGGYEDSTERSHVVADFVHQALDRGVIRLLTTGAERRQFVHIDDVCRGFHAALSQGVREVCDVTSFAWTTVLDVARIVGELTGAEVIPGARTGSTPMTPNRNPVPGWRAEVDIREGLDRMVREFRRRKAQRRAAADAPAEAAARPEGPPRSP